MTGKFNISIVITFIIILPSILFSQNRPFPQQTNFDNCIKPAGITQEVMDYYISDFYKYWKEKYLKTSGSTPGGYYIEAKGTGGPNTVTVSEAHGYGMIVFALIAGTGSYADPNAKEYFDGMYDFFKDHPSQHGNNLMTWAIQSNGSGGEISSPGYTATDGDLDIAYALILAHYQWGSSGSINYLAQAKNMINAIKSYEINSSNKRVMICGNSSDAWLSRCSDWMTDHFRTYYKVTGDSFWNDVVNTIYSTYNTLSSNYSAQTGLVSDFINYEDPQPYPYSDGITHYSYDACRFPWRIATDYAHYTASEAKNICNKMLNWLIAATGGDPNQIMAEYELNGTPIGDFNSTAFTAPFLAACIVDKSSVNLDYGRFLGLGWNFLIAEESKADYYEDSINLLCMMLISGNWWKPDPTPIQYEPKTNNSNNNINLVISSPASSKSINISYTLIKKTHVKLAMYNLQGKLITEVIQEYQNEGPHTVTADLNGNTLSNGIYFMNMAVGDKVFNQKFKVVF